MGLLQWSNALFDGTKDEGRKGKKDGPDQEAGRTKSAGTGAVVAGDFRGLFRYREGQATGCAIVARSYLRHDYFGGSRGGEGRPAPLRLLRRGDIRPG